ncbi:MAG: hypothetical protein WDM76_03640 [Limisphaerales bacterium]
MLFTAISTDTGSFQYATTRPGTFHAGAELVTRGANLAKICDEVYQSYPVSRARLLKLVYSKFRLTAEDRIAWFWLKKADLTPHRPRTATTPKVSLTTSAPSRPSSSPASSRRLNPNSRASASVPKATR